MSVQVEMMLPHMVADWAAREPSRNVLTFVELVDGEMRDETRTYGELWDNGKRIATALAEIGMRRDDRFALLMQNHPEFVDIMVGSGIVDTTFVPIDPRTQGDKLVFMLDFAECRGVVVADYALPALAEVLNDLEYLEWVWVLDTGAGHTAPDSLSQLQRVADILARPLPDDMTIVASEPDAPMQMLYTSGTTGDPKAILTPYAKFGSIGSLGAAIGMGPGNVLYTGLSLSHANAQVITLGNGIKQGAPCVVSRKFTKSRLWDICRAYGCTQFNMLGGMTTAIYSEPEKDDDADNPVTHVLSAGMPAAIWERFKQRFGVEIYEFYGTAEGGVCFNQPGTGPVGSIGKPPPTMLARVVDEDDNEVGPHEHGELVFQNADGSCAPVEYYKLPEKSAAKTRGGWFRSGDIGHYDEEGWLYFDYRDGDAIRHNGDFVDPGFVQKEIAEHPLVDDVFVYGVPAASGVPGEKDPVAAVVPVAGVDFDVARLFAFCRDRLKGNFVPVYIQVMDEIPKTASEKPQERFCREAFENQSGNVYSRAAVGS